MKVRDVMTTQISMADSNTPISQVAKQMKDLNVGSIPITDDQKKPVGIVTDRDIVVRGVVEGINSNDTIGRVMSSKVISVSPDTDIHEAANIMGENQIRRLPVVENGKLVGIVAIGDLAVRNIYEDEAGHALGEISTPSRPIM